MISIKNKKLILTVIIVLLLISAALGILEKTNVIDLFKPSLTTSSESETTSTEPSAQADFSDGSNENKGEAANSLKENKGSAVVSDQNGTGVSESPDPVTSPDGTITVYSPSTGASLKSGASVSGISKTSLVSYRIIDSTSGVIASGELKVVDGKFSGSITFNTSAPEGRLDIYATRQDGSEYSNIEIPIKFQ